ncbi:hypothetical protein FOL47_005490 [Perkinsus chesapeaki]|uniref:Tyr recombinase domain-containing protein n=1 Tax=Perkinsus chesapeaki TaxID=330153 RepID=A0A7J6LXD0_PERCH|nr:hypothetical protein FOL47_005490 [Perkinsus chesapeaki]
MRAVWRPLIRPGTPYSHPTLSRVNRVVCSGGGPGGTPAPRGTSRQRRLEETAARSSLKTLEDFVASGLSDSTHKQRSSAYKSYVTAVEAAGLNPQEFNVINVVAWLHAMASSSYAYATITNYLGNVRRQFKERGVSDLNAQEERVIELALRAARKVVGDPGPKKAVALSLEQIVTVAAGMSQVDSDLLLAGVMGLFRCSELFSLLAGHVQVTCGGASLFINKSKTDQYWMGKKVFLGCVAPIPVTGHTCGLDACVAHRLVRRSILCEAPDSNLFDTDRQSFAERLRARVVDVIGCHPSYATTHLMRRSGAVIYHRYGVPLVELAQMGRWSNSSSLEGYLQHVADAPGYFSELTAEVWRERLWFLLVVI